MTHPEPRVEWEVVLGDKPGLWYKLKHNGKTERMGCPDNLKELGRYLTRAFNDFLSHSVQEAKAEERERIQTEIALITARNVNKQGTFTNIHILANDIANFISTLNTKTSLKQEEEK